MMGSRGCMFDTLMKFLQLRREIRIPEGSPILCIPGNMIIGVYRNDYALRMLDASVEAGIEAPIRFYITENEDGSATLSYKTPSHVFSPYFATAKPELAVLAQELDVIFDKIAQRAISGD